MNKGGWLPVLEEYRSLCKLSMYLRDDLLTQNCGRQLVDFIPWCYGSCDDQTKTVSGKLAAVQYFLRVRVGVELPTSHLVLKKISKVVSCGTQPRVRRRISREML